MQLTHSSNTPAAIWTRLLRPEEPSMTPAAADFFLKLAFDQHDLDRMHELAVKNQSGKISASELEELKNYRQIGLELDMLRATARGTIQKTNNRH
jgi:uncharacterized protein YnzC (UPF0291/DUF896 family)